MFKTELFKTAFGNGIATVIKMSTGLISNKIIAIYLGPSGVALLGQFSNFTTIVNSVASLGIGNGITKYVAENREDIEVRRKLLSTGIKLLLASTLVVSLVIFVFARQLSAIILHDPKYQSIFYVFAFSIVLFALNSFFIAVLNGHKEYKKIISVNILSSFLALAVAVVFVLKYGIFGALIGTILSTSIIAVVSFLFVYSAPWFSLSDYTSGFNFSWLKKLNKYTIMSFVSLFAISYIQLLIRTFIIKNLSIENAGIWQGIIRISEIYLAVITTTLSIYYLPRFSELKDPKDIRREIFRGYSFILPVLFVSSLAIYLLKDIIVQILFSSSFVSMKELFLFQLLGNIFKVASWLISFLMVAKAMTRQYVITELFFGLSLYGLTVLFLRWTGVVGATYSYCINYMIYFFVMLWMFRKILWQKNSLAEKSALE